MPRAGEPMKVSLLDFVHDADMHNCFKLLFLEDEVEDVNATEEIKDKNIHLNQATNTKAVLDWFKSIKNKKIFKFLLFDEIKNGCI